LQLASITWNLMFAVPLIDPLLPLTSGFRILCLSCLVVCLSRGLLIPLSRVQGSGVRISEVQTKKIQQNSRTEPTKNHKTGYASHLAYHLKKMDTSANKNSMSTKHEEEKPLQECSAMTSWGYASPLASCVVISHERVHRNWTSRLPKVCLQTGCSNLYYEGCKEVGRRRTKPSIFCNVSQADL